MFTCKKALHCKTLLCFSDEIERTPDYLASIPKITDANKEDVVLNIEGMILRLKDIKTLELMLSRKDQECMDTIHKGKYPTGYVNDSVIDAFLQMCQRNNKKTGMFVISASRGSSIGLGDSKHQSYIKKQLESVELENFNEMLCPVNIGRHWILAHVNMSENLYKLTGNAN